MENVSATVDDIRQFATESLSERSTAVTLAIGILAVTLLLPALFSPNKLSKIPLLGQEFGNYSKREKAYLARARQLYREGYAKFNDSKFRLTTTDGEHLVLPYRLLDELRHRTDEEISNRKALEMLTEGKHTGLISDSDLLNHTVRSDLTTGLVRINPRLSKEVEKAVETEMPPCKDWTPVNINRQLLRIVAIASGHIFIGPELCRDERYIHASINYTVDVFTAVRALKKWSKSFRWLGAYFTPELKGIKEHKGKAKEFLAPVIEERKEMMRKGEPLPDDMLQWTINKAPKFNSDTIDQIAFTQLTLSMAAIHTTTMTTTHIMYDLASMPEMIDVLRKEIRTVLNEYDGVFTTKALYSMKKLDSFIKESQRMNPLSFARFVRVVGKPLTLSDGTYLPSNTIIEVPNDAVESDSTLFPNPDTFDPYRFYNLRQAGSEHINRHQAVTVSETSLGFGYGKHACPGRFFAINEIKLILANLLLQFDIKMKDGETGRIPNITIAHSQIPNPMTELLFKRVAS